MIPLSILKFKNNQLKYKNLIVVIEGAIPSIPVTFFRFFFGYLRIFVTLTTLSGLFNITDTPKMLCHLLINPNLLFSVCVNNRKTRVYYKSA